MAANELTLAEIEKLVAPLVTRLNQVEQSQQALRTSAPSAGNSALADLAQELNSLKDRVDNLKAQPHPGGLCGDATCVPCVDTQGRFAKRQADAILANRKDIFTKINRAAQLEDLIEPATLLHARFVEIEKGTPGPQVINLPGGQRLVLA